MSEFFQNYSALIVFLHVISAVIWVGGMIAIRFAIHYSIQEIQEPKLRLERTLENLKRFFYMVIPTILTLLITAIIMILALGFEKSSLYSIAMTKEIIWTIMAIVFITIYLRRNKAQKYFKIGDFEACKKTLLPIAKYYIPLNIILGLTAIYLGVVLRGL
ncbi:hypothetical protein [Malaciobacter mytili]|uniref:Copper resistance protein D n=1 Tax=Malaciobacter mytili LMG 24559 TaxID=1032238 RepID=A0AAX2ADW0_9BACT|nr:hypothetical protein [Malaciobacter mytili]AXH13920.1 putative membrane protein [Malaciobacter mytili LMG 24559]RXK14810.1 hypothetical protein CP985_11685 [Malaciobacter mytili LMG 24559]